MTITRKEAHRRFDAILHALGVPDGEPDEPEPRVASARITVDPGHGGNDGGAVAEDGTREKDVVLVLASILAEELTGRGHRVQTTRDMDVFVPLGDRAAHANANESACFVSVHANAAASPEAHGAWVLHHSSSEEGRRLAACIFEAMAKVPGVPDADPEAEVYGDSSPWTGGRSLAVLRETRMPAVLVELGFVTNAGDLEDLTDPVVRAAIARAIADGIEDWLATRPDDLVA